MFLPESQKLMTEPGLQIFLNVKFISATVLFIKMEVSIATEICTRCNSAIY